MIMKNYMENKLKKGNFFFFTPSARRPFSTFLLFYRLSSAHWPPSPTRLFCFTFFLFLFDSRKRFEVKTIPTSVPFAIPFTFTKYPPTIFHQPSLFACLPAINFFRFFLAALPFFALFSHFDAKKQGGKNSVCVLRPLF